mmetsp:Transcript_74896/g.178133  ORF Transcript_74896/g.178133 Transcript_74896/m.178133 type:complete len:270 (+) Transcript_74896:152-961(+)
MVSVLANVDAPATDMVSPRLTTFVTESVLAKVVALLTYRVLRTLATPALLTVTVSAAPNVVSPFADKVVAKVVALATFSVLPKVVTPVTSNKPPTVASPLASTKPDTVKLPPSVFTPPVESVPPIVAAPPIVSGPDKAFAVVGPPALTYPAAVMVTPADAAEYPPGPISTFAGAATSIMMLPLKVASAAGPVKAPVPPDKSTTGSQAASAVKLPHRFTVSVMAFPKVTWPFSTAGPETVMDDPPTVTAPVLVLNVPVDPLKSMRGLAVG